MKIYSRVYFNEPNHIKLADLSERQQIILNCILSRHHNGFIRQEQLKMLAHSNEAFVIPFKVQLLGEYVIEIIETLNRQLNDDTIELIDIFISNNGNFWNRTKSRVASYWNEYYRNKYPNYSAYLGKQIIDRVELAIRKTSK